MLLKIVGYLGFGRQGKDLFESCKRVISSDRVPLEVSEMVIGCNQDREGVSVVAFALMKLRRACLLLTIWTTAFRQFGARIENMCMCQSMHCEFRDGSTYDDGTDSWLSMFRGNEEEEEEKE